MLTICVSEDALPDLFKLLLVLPCNLGILEHYDMVEIFMCTRLREVCRTR